MAFDISTSSFLEPENSLLGVVLATFEVQTEIVLDMLFLIVDTLYLAGEVWLVVGAYEISCDCYCEYDYCYSAKKSSVLTLTK